ncbi:MAG: DNA primase [Proteobacteria bacterium]|nr:DNA primase [Burkholderiales bacterium]
MIPPSFIQDLLARVDIVEVVERWVPLKREGSNHVACCPFHNEKSPSFKVSQPKQIYKCFGCGVSGNAIGFVMAYQGVEFVEAVRALAEQLGMPVPEESWRGDAAGKPDDSGAETTARLHEHMREATRFYREQLKHHPRAVDYLKQRGLTGEIATRFAIGFVPPGWQNLEKVFANYTSPELEQVGLVVNGDSGRRFDFFRNRVMFPILSQRGVVVGFGGRVIDPEDQPKYLNSRETPLFDKGRELYNLFAARRAIRDAGRVLVVEGYMDVVGLAQHGVDYAVAALGTATTPAHVQKLLRQTDNVVFAFDGDAAGRRAAWRAVETGLGQLIDGKNLAFLFLPQGDDPDSFIRREGRPAFEALIAAALPLSAFMLRELTQENDLGSEEGRTRLLRDARPLIAQLQQAPMLAAMMRKRIAELARIEVRELETHWRASAGKADESMRGGATTPSRAGEGQGSRSSAVHAAVVRRTRPAPSLVRTMLQCLLSKPELVSRVQVPDELPVHPELRALRMMIGFLRNQPSTIRAAGVMQAFSGTEYEELLREVEADAADWSDLAEVQTELDAAVERMREQVRRDQATTLAGTTSLAGLTPEMRDTLRGLLRRPSA